MRYRLLKHTRLNVVAFLNELPKTQHDTASFNVDVNTYTVCSAAGSDWGHRALPWQYVVLKHYDRERLPSPSTMQSELGVWCNMFSVSEMDTDVLWKHQLS